MLFGIEWSARASIDAEYLYHGSDPTREPRLEVVVETRANVQFALHNVSRSYPSLNTPTDHEFLLHASVDPNSSGWEWKTSKLDEGG